LFPLTFLFEGQDEGDEEEEEEDDEEEWQSGQKVKLFSLASVKIEEHEEHCSIEKPK
jgi:hypothetical protein